MLSEIDGFMILYNTNIDSMIIDHKIILFFFILNNFNSYSISFLLYLSNGEDGLSVSQRVSPHATNIIEHANQMKFIIACNTPYLNSPFIISSFGSLISKQRPNNINDIQKAITT